MLRKKDRNDLEKLNKEWENWSDLIDRKNPDKNPDVQISLLELRISQLEKFIANLDIKQED